MGCATAPKCSNGRLRIACGVRILCGRSCQQATNASEQLEAGHESRMNEGSGGFLAIETPRVFLFPALAGPSPRITVKLGAGKRITRIYGLRVHVACRRHKSHKQAKRDEQVSHDVLVGADCGKQPKKEISARKRTQSMCQEPRCLICRRFFCVPQPASGKLHTVAMGRGFFAT